MALSNVPKQVEDNLKARKNSAMGMVRSEVGLIKSTANKQIGIGKSAVQNVLGLKPIPAVIDTVVDTIENIADALTGTIDNVGEGIKDQGRITREWLPDRLGRK